MKEMERLIDDEFSQMKATVEAEKLAKKEAKRAAKKADAASDGFPDGATVLIDGLAAKPELNGQKGCILSFDDTKMRYAVRVETGLANGDSILLKGANLTLCEAPTAA